MQPERMFNLTSDLVTYSFCRIFPSEGAHLRRCFAKNVGEVYQPHFFFGQDLLEIQ